MLQILALVALGSAVMLLWDQKGFRDWFEALPELARIVVGLAILCIVMGTAESVVEKRPIAAAAENSVAWFMHLLSLLAAFGGAYWVNKKINTSLQYKAKTLRAVLGILAAIAVFFLVATGLLFVGSQIPGVGWRIENQMGS